MEIDDLYLHVEWRFGGNDTNKLSDSGLEFKFMDLNNEIK
ncbi:hypothetical protein bcgnr5369_15280 [Bacillus cereus]